MSLVSTTMDLINRVYIQAEAHAKMKHTCTTPQYTYKSKEKV